ncbi:MAG: beta-galactosidase [Sphingomonas sp.]|jgi:beta-galactosidase|uniref:beta-galactosidase n=1 Tax=Sphingomonas sp. TaxID=28214 RepID=UPI003563BC0E
MRKAFGLSLAALLLLQPARGLTAAAEPSSSVSQILYGSSYYSEYMPADVGPDRIATDVALMRQAGIRVVRMGESSWATFEPADGRFDFAWMDRAVAAFGAAGIKVILGTPTYSLPPWLARAHPELLARPLGGGAIGYGMRQNMNYDDPLFRGYAERIVTRLVTRYRDNPAVIGWQLDNETGPNGAANDDIFSAFVGHLKTKFGTPETLDRAWLLNYWGQAIHDWDDMPRPDFSVSPSYKLEWNRFQKSRVTRYLAWQAMLVRKLRRPDQIVLHDFASAMRGDVDEFAIAPLLDVVGINVYHAAQDKMDGQWQAMTGDYARSLKRQNYFVTETSAQTIGWNSQGQYPPFDGQLRLDLYANVASGANMLLYWHWTSLHAGLETYWKGVLGHDLKPGRAYAEVRRTGAELARLGPAIANLKVRNQVAILYSADSATALSLMPYQKEGGGDWKPEQTSGYATTLRQMHRALYQADIGVDFLSANDPALDLTRYKLVLIPSLYIADDGLLQRIEAYVRGGGHALMTIKSGFANQDNAVRAQLAPGPLAEVAGFTYQEFSTLDRPVALKGDPFGAGEANQVGTWAEFIALGTAHALAWYDDPALARWPAITRNRFGAGSLTYEGTLVSDGLQYSVVRDLLRESGVSSLVPVRPDVVRTREAVGRDGRPIRFFFNFSSRVQIIAYRHPGGTDLLRGKPVGTGQVIMLEPWDLAIVRESRGGMR